MFRRLVEREIHDLLGMTAPLMVLAIPLLDVGLAVVRRLLRGQPILLPTIPTFITSCFREA